MKWAIISIVSGVSGVAWATTTSGDYNDYSNIHFDRELIPCLDEQFDKLPVYSLEPPTIFPPDKFDEILGCAAPGRTLNRTQTENGCLVYDGDRLVGFVDNTTGESTIFPHLSTLNPAEYIPTDRIHEFISDYNIFPTDDTVHDLVDGFTLSGSTKNETTDATPPAAYLKDMYIDRTINYRDQQFPACGAGAGNKAFFSFGAEGKIHSLTHRWRAARLSDSTIVPLPRDDIYNSIKNQLCVLGGTSIITVDSVDVCFYESGGAFMQPVYRFSATVEDGNPDTLPQPILGYVPIGASPPESVPVILPLEGQVLPSPVDSSTSSRRGVLNKRAKDIKVGRYVGSNNITLGPVWVEDANYFLDGLLRAGSRNFNIINSQYYWAEPLVYTTSKDTYINSVHLAYTVGHGSPHTVYTNELLPGGGPVDISSDPSGYGPGPYGSLAYWIIKSCNVTLSPDDIPFNDAFAPWWNVFNGLHAIMTYRTFSWSSDYGEGTSVGFSIASGASVLHSWMKGVNQNSQNRRRKEDFERASAVTVCGHADDTLWQTERLARPGCLQMWWYRD